VIERGNDGWPKRIRDVRDIPVITRRPLRNAHMVIPAGTEGTVYGSSRWNMLAFTGKKCECCSVQPRVHGCSRQDFDPV
jgi:hypothetical protein